jgi:hypothetical protein
MAGIYGTDAGRIFVDGQMSTFIELGVGFNPDLPARENVMINATMLGLSPREARNRFDRVIDFAELREFTELKLKNYSSGMMVRLAFSVMIQVDADILLIDEVLAVGDAAFQQKCFEEFERIKRSNTTSSSSPTTWAPSSASATARCCSSTGARWRWAPAPDRHALPAAELLRGGPRGGGLERGDREARPTRHPDTAMRSATARAGSPTPTSPTSTAPAPSSCRAATGLVHHPRPLPPGRRGPVFAVGVENSHRDTVFSPRRSSSSPTPASSSKARR